MTRSRPRSRAVLVAGLAVLGCRDQTSPSDDTETTSTGATDHGDTSDDTGPIGPDRAAVTHGFGQFTLSPHQELQPCIQWTVGNEQAIYVEAVTLANDGGFHHSNWFVVPEELYPGEDGFFDCEERGFTELEAAVQGTVLTAQSTQSRYERMELPPGVVVKIPAHHKIVAGGHLLNLAAADYETELRMTLDIVHPQQVEVVAAPFRLTYYALDIPPFTEARFSSSCSFAGLYESAADASLDLRIYYVLPHYHYLGNFFDLSILGGPLDGQSVYRLEGFDADANGQTYPQPIDLIGAEGLTFTCGYDNWTDKNIGWGVGDQEMCVMLGLADSALVLDGSASANQVVGVEGEVLLSESPCNVLGLPKKPTQELPTPEELQAPLYVPPSDPGDVDLPPVDECVDVPDDAMPSTESTLSQVRDTLFVSSCQFSSCHAGAAAAAGLDLAAAELRTELLEHAVKANTELPLVAPGDPEGSWLYQVVAQCRPEDASGTVVSHMPLNSPRLSDPGLVAALREWIAAGAPND
ncbi:hypothetical protein [Paraliomyxa miuraensis]|uniref:hypothetical protein n=1 Tax=Paraliomyxa miuraensis TaxID=376150 RepID=UPI00225C1CC4|nr:hypothetical protein [Paraliomyxa miuraensis]MCX4246087.1 hypothetical protein [Paraliomyxa miuraensis]